MEDPQSIAEPRPSQALTPPDGKSTEGMQEANPSGSVANTTAQVQAYPSKGPVKPMKGRNKFLVNLTSIMRNVLRSVTIGFRKLGILMWKNFLFRARSWILFTFEFSFAIFCILIVLLVGPPANIDLINKPATDPISLTKKAMIEEFVREFRRQDVAYAGKNPEAEKVIHEIDDEIIRLLNSPSQIRWTHKSNENEVVKEFNENFANPNPSSDLKGAIIFEKLTDKEVRYKIRLVQGSRVSSGLPGRDDPPFDTDKLFPSDFRPGPHAGHATAYNKEGILGLQLLIDESAVKVLRRTGLTPEEVTLKTFPYPKYKTTRDAFQIPIFNAFCVFYLYIYIFATAFLMKNVGSEKQTGVRELLKLCGYPGWMQWLAWYLVTFLVESFFTFLILIVIFNVPGFSGDVVVKNSDFSLWFFMLSLYAISNYAFGIFFATIIKSTSVAMALVIIPMVVFPLPGFFIFMPFLIPQSFPFLMGMSAFPYGCLYVAMKYLYEFEALGIGAQWNVIDEPIPKASPRMNMGYVILMFLLNIVVYQTLAVYLESVLPSEYGIRKPFYYPILYCPLKAIFRPFIGVIKWIKNRKKGKEVANNVALSAVPSESKATGFEPYNGPATTIGVDIQGLTKKFDEGKYAVNGVNVKMYEGEIFALLGHNGAGKTTLISMLTGMFAPTRGTAKVGGHDIITDMGKVRESLGLCPQHDMLFKNLTVMEHLSIFGAMKGKSCAMVKKEANMLLNMMRLTDKANTTSKNLSGGQKRKLCLAMALIGEAKVVVLDEPTSGMDPEARRAIWDILLQIRGKRTILLTTHFMEEADVLGDRIGIMAEGRLQCCGSSTYLKKFYGTGYTLKVSLFPGGDRTAILPVVQKHISDATLKPIIMPNEIFISLPTETTNSSTLTALFSTLAAKKQEMYIESLGLSVASMDEVFIKVGELSGRAAVDVKELLEHTTKPSEATIQGKHPHKKKPHTDHNPEPVPTPTESATIHEAEIAHAAAANMSEAQGSTVAPAESKIPPSATPSKPTVVKSKRMIMKQGVMILKLIMVQSLAILIKRFICTRRKLGLLLFQIIFSALLMLIVVLVANEALRPSSLPKSLEITLDSYKKPVTLYSADQSQFQKVKEAIGSSTKSVANVEDALKKAGDFDIISFREKLIVAGELSANAYTAWFNTIPLHAAPLAIKLASDVRGATFDPPVKFYVSIHPMQTKQALRIRAALKTDDYAFPVGFILYFMLLFLLPTLAVTYTVYPTEERLNQSRQLQLMTGMYPWLYWMVTFIWDFFVFAITAIVMISVLASFETFKVFTSYHALDVIFLMLLAFGYSMIPLAYVISHLPRTTTGAGIVMLFFLLIPQMLSFLISYISKEAAAEINKMSLFVGIVKVFQYIGEAATINAKCNYLGEAEKKLVCSPQATIVGIDELRACCKKCANFGVPCFSPLPYLTWLKPPTPNLLGGQSDPNEPGVAQYLMWWTIGSLICQAILVFIVLGGYRFLRSLMIKADGSEFLDQVTDQDVREEKQRIYNIVMQGSMASEALVVDNLCKNFGGFSAVSKLTFGVHHGECFGLLGTNGAGKTTTFRIITGDELQSFGDSYEGRLTLRKNRRKFISNIGYCPQFDAFVPHLTGKENLQMFARLRGVPWCQVNREVINWLEKVGLTKSGNVVSKKYSGGMKRRLSAAVAMIGNPALVLLDEPTSGVDPVSRRQFWKVLETVKASGKSIILTSHSMDECETLCSRLGIMVNGQLQCIGGVQHLKHKFAQGYSLTLRLKTQLQPQSQSVQPQPQQFQFQQPQYVTQQVQQPQYSRQLQNPYEQRQPQSPQQGMFNPQMYQPPPQYQQTQMFQQANFSNMSGSETLPILHAEICEKFHPCTLKDQHETVLQYQIENTALGWDVIYKTLEDLKKSYGDIIEDYSVSETSLEEVFLAFSRGQYPPRDSKIPMCKRILTCQC